MAIKKIEMRIIPLNTRTKTFQRW